MFIQAFIPKLPVEALHVGILLGLPRIDEMQSHSPLAGPAIQRLAGELRAVVNHDHLWHASLPAQLFQHPRHPFATERGVDFNPHALPCVVIHHIQGPETSPHGQTVRHEIHRPPSA